MKVSNSHRKIWRLKELSAMLAAVGLVAPVQAGNHWLSRVNFGGKNQAENAVFAKNIATAGGRVTAQGDSSVAVFEITISLDADPRGDDDASVTGTNDGQQREYEDRIKEFARAVYQSSNGALKIGKVWIYRKGDQAASADVIWNENCAVDKGPRANVSGFGVAGRHIWMCTNWGGAPSLMSTAKGSGYTLAHEWGHYAYGLFDEYAQNQCNNPSGCAPSVPLRTDAAALPSIMNNQWAAAGGGVPAGYSGKAADFLEFSTENIHPFRSDSTGWNAQKRVYGKSAWQTLTSDSASDPKFSWMAQRTRYVSLAAPSAPNWIVSDEDSTALSDLDIRWVSSQITKLTIDRSGSMQGSPMSNAKTAATLLIDQLKEGNTAIGVNSFSHSVTLNYPITDIPSPDTGVKNAAKAAVGGLYASGSTALYNGLMAALQSVKNFSSGSGTSRPSVVYVLSDGEDNASSYTESQVISAFKAARVPIVAFAYGSGAPGGTLSRMAAGTGGAFYQSPTTLPEIQAALLAANAAFSSNLLVSSAPASTGAGGMTTMAVPLDSTLATARINLSYTGSASDFSFRLLLPNGSDSGQNFICSGATSCSVLLDEAFFAAYGYGNYQVQMTNNTGVAKDAALLVMGTPAGTAAYDISTEFSSNVVSYPADMAIRATVSRGAAITGLDVRAQVAGPDGKTLSLQLLDDGVGADQIANDGTYSASIPYKSDGVYSATVLASNASGKAQTSFNGVYTSLREDGTAYQPSVETIKEDFARMAVVTASAVGVRPDDHSNDPASGACTVVADDNVDIVGRVDSAGDADCFVVVPRFPGKPLTLRVTSLTSGMEPVLRVYDSKGALLRKLGLADSENTESGLIWTLPSEQLDPQGLVLSLAHADSGATSGGYAVSAGMQIASDTVVVAPSPGGGDGGGNGGGGQDSSGGGGGGGGTGPLALVFLAVLGWFGARRRAS